MRKKSQRSVIDAPLPPEYAEAFNLAIKMVSLRLDNEPDRLRAVNDSLMADLLGDDPLPVPLSSVDPSVVRLLHAIIQLMQVPHNFEAMTTMVRLYPWRGKISRAQHLESCYYLIVHETYIFEERLKAVIKALVECAESRSLEVELAPVSKLILQLHKGMFGQLVAARGIHVHQQSNVPREIKRLGTLELLMTGKVSQADKAPWAMLHRLALQDARKRWLKNADDAGKAARYIIAQLLVHTQLVWRTVIQQELDKSENRHNQPKARN